MRRIVLLAATVCLAAFPAAVSAARALSYQGFTSQGFEIRFKKAKAGVLRMSITVRARCENQSGQNLGDYDFFAEATDGRADVVSRGRFTTVLVGKNSPRMTITGKFNSRGVARGTVKASGAGKDPQGAPLPKCKSPTVRWTAGS